MPHAFPRGFAFEMSRNTRCLLSFPVGKGPLSTQYLPPLAPLPRPVLFIFRFFHHELTSPAPRKSSNLSLGDATCAFLLVLLLFVKQVSGSALGMEGQVSVFHHHHRQSDGGGDGGGGGGLGPCYRCVFPAPLAAEAGRRCSDNGVLGTVPGERRGPRGGVSRRRAGERGRERERVSVGLMPFTSFQ